MRNKKITNSGIGYLYRHSIKKIKSGKSFLLKQWVILKNDKMALAGVVIIFFFLTIAVTAPWIAPYKPTERIYTANGTYAKYLPPSWEHPLGTTAQGMDIFSQLIYASRVTLLIGFSAGFFIAIIGTLIGTIAGYYGGIVDDILMRITDIVFGLPFLPTIILLVAFLGPGIFNFLFAISLLSWRSAARVIRSQVLTLKNQPYILAAKVAGASNFRIIFKYIIPNVLPLTFLYGAFGVGWAIITEAGVSFLGLGDPKLISWGTMLQEAMIFQALLFGAWWWFVPPGICIMLTVMAIFLIGRGYEEVLNPRLREI